MNNSFIWLALLGIIACGEPNTIAKVIDQYESFRSEESESNSNWNVYDSLHLANQNKSISSILENLKQIDYDMLSAADKVNYDMLDLVLTDQVVDYNYGAHLMPLNAEGGFISSILFRFRNFSAKSNLEDYQKRLDDLPNYLEGQKKLLQQGIKENRVATGLVVENCYKILNDQLQKPWDESFLVQPIQSLDSEYKTGIYNTIENETWPALQQFRNFLREEYLTSARSGVGILHLPDGKEYYAHKVKYFTTLDLTPEEVFETGQAEVKRIRAEMMDIIRELNFEGSFSDFVEFLRTDPQFYPKTPEELLKEAAWLSKKAEEILPAYFNKLPRLPFTVNPVPAAIAPTYTGGRYSGGSFGQQKAGEYWVNTYKLESRPYYVLPALTLHEAVPGHHLQISLAQELEGLPNFRQNTYLSAYGEGWGLYSEFLGKEAGLYRTPYEDFGRLTYEMWRACRLVVDPGIHYFDWSREKAVKFLSENTALSLHEVNTEIDRYIGWPAQAVSYKIGELKIRELRKKAEQALGENFNIRSFHDEVLKNGSVPLNSLQNIIEEYIDNQKK